MPSYVDGYASASARPSLSDLRVRASRRRKTVWAGASTGVAAVAAAIAVLGPQSILQSATAGPHGEGFVRDGAVAVDFCPQPADRPQADGSGACLTVRSHSDVRDLTRLLNSASAQRPAACRP